MNYHAAGSQIRLSWLRHSRQSIFGQSCSSSFVTALLLGLVFIASSSMSRAAGLFTPTPFSEDGVASDATDTAQKAANSRAVRLSSVEGAVRVVQDGEVIADPALANQPLFEGSEITTGNEGRAEIQFEDGSVARLSPNTTLALSVLQKQATGARTEIVMNSGLAYFELQPSTPENSFRVNYGPAGFTASSFSVVRVISDAPPASLAVFSGNIHLARGENLQLDIHSGQSVNLEGGNSASYNVTDSIEPDSWDAWNADRDEVLNAESADRTAATGSLKDYPNVGLSDLDANGNWYNVPGQGYVWSPYDAQLEGASWDPYGYGHWVYYPRFGYVWVSDYTWGYAPFQCGLWNYFDNFGWGWAPGAGCNPWWGNGFYGAGYYGGGGWGYRLGNYPPGYHPPRRPLPGPIHPLPRPGPHPVQNPGHNPIRVHEGPVKAPIGVDHRSVAVSNPPPTSRPAGPVTIAGRTVEPLRPVAPRQAYGQSGSQSGGQSFVNRSAPPQSGLYTGAGHTIDPGVPAHPVTGQSGLQPGSRPYSPPAYHPAPPPAYHPAPAPARPSAPMGGGGSAPHSAPAPAPHK
jgi:hypothetical protein